MASQSNVDPSLLKELENPHVGPRPRNIERYWKRTENRVRVPNPPVVIPPAPLPKRGGIAVRTRQRIGQLRKTLKVTVNENDKSALLEQIKIYRKKEKALKKLSKAKKRALKNIKVEKKN